MVDTIEVHDLPAGSTLTADDQIIVQNAPGTTPLTQRYTAKQVAEYVRGGVYNAAEFGAVGTGAAIQAAIDQAAAENGARGAVVLVPAAVWDISATIEIPDVIELRGLAPSGQPNRGVRLHWTGGASPVVRLLNVTAPKLSGFTFQNSGTATIAIEIVSGCYQAMLDDITIMNPTTPFSEAAIKVGTATTPMVILPYFHRVYVLNAAPIGIKLGTVNAMVMQQTSSFHHTDGSLVAGDASNLVSQLSVFGGGFEGAANASSIILNHADNPVFFGTYMESDGTGFAVDIPSTATKVLGALFSGCRFIGDAWGNPTPYVMRIAQADSTLDVFHPVGKRYGTGSSWIKNDASRRVYIQGNVSDSTISSLYSAQGNVGYGPGDLNGVVSGFDTSVGYHVGSIQVLGAQGAAVADATDAPSAITQLNTLLARLRAHGLLAT